MNFHKSCTIPVARPELWNFLLDVPQMATCVPGVEEINPAGDNRYDGRLKVKLGPIALNLQGAVTIQERDQEKWRAVAKAEAKDRRIGGSVNLTTSMTLVEQGPDVTELVIDANTRFLGKLGEFGEPLIRKQTDATIQAFANNVAARFKPATAPTGTEAVAAQAAQPVPPASQPIWAGKLIGLCLGIVLWIISIIIPSPSSAPDWLRMLSVTVALVIIGDVTQRAIRTIRARKSTQPQAPQNSTSPERPS